MLAAAVGWVADWDLTSLKLDFVAVLLEVNEAVVRLESLSLVGGVAVLETLEVRAV
jgi:hypothetical protein